MIYQVRYTHEVIGSGSTPIEAESYDHAAETLRRDLKIRHPNAMIRINSEVPRPLSDTEAAAQEDGS